MQIQTQVTQRLELSLKALTLSPKEALASSPRSVVSPRTRNLHNLNITTNAPAATDIQKPVHHHQPKPKPKVERVFPPPLPMLARTQNLHSHMPWKLKRYYTPDGRLILREEKVRHHEYFRAHRANGRLTLQLVPLDHHLLDSLPLCCNIHNPLSPRRPINDQEEKRSVGDDDEVPLEKDKDAGGMEYDNGSGGKCLKNCSIHYSFFGVPQLAST